ncbi:eukaryotic translation initiation factor 3 subunit I [Caerostris extrusa]|uniref:Eukaryotic translation initiation factor 3 subunit I n=1 Tax=Caerostris extrusa TaxID=172846 RepID=A0AAV4WZ26_CAEEX|nr:eukaryotic translation initiation factor 3 subunit I [Caerostris extrusa]
MKPLMLHGHERAITQIKYNREGDLLFSCSKDPTPNVWYSVNGERLGTFDGHNGSVWCIDVNWDSTKVATGAADAKCGFWDLETGVCLKMVETDTSVRTCNFSYSGKLLMYSTDKSMGKQCEIKVVDTLDPAQMCGEGQVCSIPVSGHKVTSAVWGPLDEYLLTGLENGALAKYDLKTLQRGASKQDHRDVVNDIQYYKDQTMFITASKDHTAKLFDTKTMDLLKVYKTERPVNSAAISPIREHVVLGGGQEAMDVTTTSARAGKFFARFYHLVFEEEFARVSGHFGPINSVAFHPDGKSFSSGGEDGYVRIQNFDSSYFDFNFEY